MVKKKICKKHRIELTPEFGEFTGRPTGRLECKHCVDNLDFWLPTPIIIGIIIGTIYYTIFPTVPELRYGMLFISIFSLILFFTMGSSLRVLKRMFKKYQEVSSHSSSK